MIDFDRIKVEDLDVMKLSKGGIVVPETAIYYDDDDIAYDEDFEGDRVRYSHHSALAIKSPLSRSNGQRGLCGYNQCLEVPYNPNSIVF